jgi:FkbH-like protein
MSLSLVDLPWLPPAPTDLSDQIRAAGTDPLSTPSVFQRLAGHALTPAQAASFSRAFSRRSRQGMDPAPLSPFRLGILTNSTFDLAAEAMVPAAVRHGAALQTLAAPYGQVMQSALDPASAIHAARPDAVLVAVDHRWFGFERPDLDGGDARVDAAMAELSAVVEGLRRGETLAILQTLAAPPQTLFGSFDRRVAGTARAMVDGANRKILALAEDTGAYVLDAAALAERVGLDHWFDPVHWNAHKLPFAPACAAVYAEGVGRLLGAIRGRARKCLVLDLDNTLWGGAIGDDGLDGIVLAQGDAAGEAFLAVQQAAADLYDRGVILAVCSKNDEDVARSPFRSHADMVLKEGHIATFQANWRDKAANLQEIAETLNLGLDALVLLDDNPAERAQVRAALPMVAVPELPADPSWFPWILLSAGYFEAVTLSREDRLRGAAYAAEAGRRQAMAVSADLGDYLSQLQMTLTTGPFDAANRPRVTQLINKTNQFNLTTRRYTEPEVAALEADPTVFTLQARLADRFGDMGLIAAMIARPVITNGHSAWSIDTWLMSCRVLGRRVEEGLLDALVRGATAAGVRWLIGEYRPTARNGMVADHYARLGFTATDAGFSLDIERYQRPSLPFA